MLSQQFIDHIKKSLKEEEERLLRNAVAHSKRIDGAQVLQMLQTATALEALERRESRATAEALEALERDMRERESEEVETWAVVDVFGHARHVGRVRVLHEAGHCWFEVVQPPFIASGYVYPETIVRLSPRAIFSRRYVSEVEAREVLSMTLPPSDVRGQPLPGQRVYEMRMGLGCSIHEAAGTLETPVEQLRDIEVGKVQITDASADEMIAKLRRVHMPGCDCDCPDTTDPHRQGGHPGTGADLTRTPHPVVRFLASDAAAEAGSCPHDPPHVAGVDDCRPGDA